MINLAKPFIPDKAVKCVVEILRSGNLVQGEFVNKFEKSLMSYLKVNNAVLVSSGTAALHLSLIALGIKPGDEVIVPAFTFPATANVVELVGAKPVFVDIDMDDFCIDPDRIEEKVTIKTKAIIPVHEFGQTADIGKIVEIAQKHDLKIVEDAACALGSEFNGKKAGTFGELGCFSFHPRKAITTGEGGAVLTNRKDIYDKLLMYRNHGITKDPSAFNIHNSSLNGAWYYEMQNLGYNYRITDIQCALGVSQLKKLDKFIKRRREIVRIYENELMKIRNIQLPIENKDVKSAWHLYPIRLKNISEHERKQIFDNLRKNGAGVQMHYIPVYWHPYYQKLGYKKGLCPTAEDYYIRGISIPLYQKFVNQLMQDSKLTVQSGEFGAHMDVELINDGPVTIITDTKNKE